MSGRSAYALGYTSGRLLRVKFFEQFPPPERDEPVPDEQPQPAWAKPEAVLGAAVPAEFLLARGGAAAV